MEKFIITTDYTADMPESFFIENKIDRVILPFTIDNKEYDGRDNTISYEEFYSKIRNGSIASTSQVSQYDAEMIFSKYLEQGYDILHLCFSSGVSSSFDNFAATVKELKVKYPERKVLVIDSLSGSGGLGIMVDKALKMQKSGKTLEEVADWIEKNKLRFNHFYVVDDLGNLKRGGRISKIEATLGMALNIKPVLSLDDRGKINAVAKLMGKKKALNSMVQRVIDGIIPEENDFIVITHGGNLSLAKELGSKIKEKLDIEIIYTDLDYLVGAHAGADVVAVFFIGKRRD